MTKTAAELLIDYGYSEVAFGLFVPARPSSERWEKVDGGWHCYTPSPGTFGGGSAWGKALDGGLWMIPFGPLPSFAAASGLHPAANPECYEWVWPEERLVEIYSHAAERAGNPWRKTDEGEFVREP